MSISLRAAIGLYCLVGLLLVLGGVGYLVRGEYLPYHELATRVPWEALSPEHQGTFLGLMKGGGAGGLAVGLGLVLLAVCGLGRRVSLTFWLLPVLGLVYLGALNYSTWYMNSTTPGGPPLGIGITLMALVCLAAGLSYHGRGLGDRRG